MLTQVQPISVLFTIPASSLPPVMAKLRAKVVLPVEASDRSTCTWTACG